MQRLLQTHGWWLALLGVLSLRIVLGGVVGLGDAEAYYYSWAQRPAAGYLDHPPMVAWLIHLSTTVFGSSTWAVRLPAAVLFTAALALVARLALDLGARPWLAAGLAFVAPFVHIGGFGANPDVPLAVFGLATLLGSIRARPVLTGCALGLALLSKASAVVFLPAVVLCALRQPRLWVALPIAAVIASPPLLWNLRAGFPTLQFQLLQRGPDFQPLLGTGRFLGGQIAYVTPPLLVLLLLALWRIRNSHRLEHRVIVWTAVSALGLGFLGAVAYPSAEPHWTLPAYLVLAAAAAADPPRRLLWWSVGFAATALVLIYLVILVPVHIRLIPSRLYEPRYDLSNELYGWPDVARSIGDRTPAASHYTMCAQLEYATKRSALCAAPRRSQFDLWPDPEVASVVFVSDARFPRPAEEFLSCESLSREPDVVIRRFGREVRRFALETCVSRAFRAPPQSAGETHEQH